MSAKSGVFVSHLDLEANGYSQTKIALNSTVDSKNRDNKQAVTLMWPNDGSNLEGVAAVDSGRERWRAEMAAYMHTKTITTINKFFLF
jgi:hypothetical protein